MCHNTRYTLSRFAGTQAQSNISDVPAFPRYKNTERHQAPIHHQCDGRHDESITFNTAHVTKNTNRKVVHLLQFERLLAVDVIHDDDARGF